MTRHVFSNDMAAHVWAQGTQDSGRGSKGAVYFEGARLFSYGSHYLTGFRLADGRALINGDSYSVTTGGHVSTARRAVTGRAETLPGLTDFDSNVLRPWAYLTEALAGLDPETAKDRRAQIMARAVKWFEGRAPYQDAAETRALFRRSGPPAFPHIGQDAAALAFEALGVPADKAARLAAKALAKRARNAAAWKQAAEAAKTAEALDLARDWSKRNPADTARELAGVPGRQYFNLAQATARAEAQGRELFRAMKAARAKGWTRMAEQVRAHYLAVRAAPKAWAEADRKKRIRAFLADRLGLVRAGRALVLEPLADVAARQADESRTAWDSKPVRVLEMARRALVDLGAVKAEELAPQAAQEPQEDSAVLAMLRRIMRALGLLTPDMSARFLADFRAFGLALARVTAQATRARNRAELAAVRAFRAAEARAAQGGAAVTEQEAKGAEAWAAARRYSWPALDPFRKAGFTAEAVKAEGERARLALNAAVTARKAAEALAWKAWADGQADTWRNFGEGPARPAGPMPREYLAQGGRLSDGNGGALLRAKVTAWGADGRAEAGTLETSWGAQVPLAHAIRAFRFLALCRAEGKAWAANGKTLHVGHFAIDRVDTAGNFRAGCHLINWPEVERVAAACHVLDLAPADTREGGQA